VIANTAIIVCFFQLFSTFGVYLKSSGFDERALGWLFTLSGVLIVATEMPVLYLVERRYKPIPTMLVGSALIIFSYLTLPLMVTISFWAILAMVLILTMGEILYMPFTNTYVAKHAPAARRGEYLGLLSSSYSFAFVITPLVGFGVAEHYGYGVATYVCCGLALGGWAILSRVNILRERKEGTVVSIQ
jgi:predicted MFS family arabinose efflux permease